METKAKVLNLLSKEQKTDIEIIKIISELSLIDLNIVSNMDELRKLINSTDEAFCQEVLKVLWHKYHDKASFIWAGQIIKNSFEHPETPKYIKVDVLNVETGGTIEIYGEVKEMEEKKNRFNLNEKVVVIVDGYPVRGLIIEVRQEIISFFDQKSIKEIFNLQEYETGFYYRVLFFDPHEGDRAINTFPENLIFKDLAEATEDFKKSFNDLAE